MNFTRQQLDAVDISRRDVDACVVAGPGSGKTTVLVEYFKRLVEAGVDPLRVLAITFTEKAAGNMRAKLAQAFEGNLDVRARLERAWVSTVHGFCSRLLRENAVFAGIDPEFSVADERESWRLQNESIATAIEDLFQHDPPAVRALVRGLSSWEFELAVLSAYDAMRCAGVAVADLDRFPAPPGMALAAIGDTVRALRAENVFNWSATQREQYLGAVETGERIVSAAGPLEALRALGDFSLNLGKCKRNNPAYTLLQTLKGQVATARFTLITEHYAAERRTLFDIFRRFDLIYRARKRKAGALDFSDLEEFSVRLLEDHPATRERLRAQFDHVLMDEFQDTNGQQARLLELIRAPGRFYAVGDLNQSIYGFRHAEPQGFRDYRDTVERCGYRLVDLTGNFRSRPAILSAVETVLDGREGIEPRRLVACREFDQPADCSVEALYAADEKAESQWIARRVRELLEAHPEFDYKDVAVLVRNTEVLASITTAFDDAGIPYVVNRGRGFYESREVKDLTHLLRIIANPRNEVSLATVLRSPLAGVSDDALLQLRVFGDAGETRENLGAVLMRLGPTHAAAFDPADFAALIAFRDRLREWRVRRDYVTFDRILLAAIDDCGYPSAPNIDKFLAQARAAAARMPLAEFVDELALVRADNPREADSPPEDSANTVKVMTIHSAKGLEFPIVFLAAMQKGIQTNLAAVEFSRRFGLGVTWRDPANGKEIADLFQNAIGEERERSEKEEGHRLLYVAMTRAEHHLGMSFSGRRQNWASVLVDSLDIDYKTPGDQRVTRTAPDGAGWTLRLHIADGAPEPLAATTIARAARPVPVPQLLPAPAITGQRDSAANVTALAAFANCPRKYYLGTYLGFDRPGPTPSAAPIPTSGLRANELGSQVHALLAGVPIPDADAEAERLAAVFRSSDLGRRAARASRIEREFDFVMSFEDLVVRGQVDLWFEEGGELVIVDYKTDAVTALEALQRAGEYALQLRLYATAVERMAGRPPDRAFLHFLRPGRIVEVDLSPSLLDSPEQIARDFHEALDTLQFPLNEAAHCRTCAFFKDLCPAGGTPTI